MSILVDNDRSQAKPIYIMTEMLRKELNTIQILLEAVDKLLKVFK